MDMKKPKITLKDGWQIFDQGDKQFLEAKSGDGLVPIAVFVTHDHEESKANAVACKAVPEMIDALIEAKKAIESLGDFDLGVTYTDSYPGDPPDGYRNKDALLHEIEQALKKAGCTE